MNCCPALVAPFGAAWDMPSVGSASAMKRLQFRMTTLLCLMTICSVFLGFHTAGARRQRQLVHRLRHEGLGDVVYGGTLCRIAPYWLESVVGIDFFGRVVEVWLYRGNLTTEDIELIKQFPHVESVTFHYDVEATADDHRLLDDHFP